MRVLVVAAALVASPISAQSSHTEQLDVPLSMHDGRLVVPVLASDGSEMSFVVSTGNAITVFTESTAAKLGDAPTLTMGGLSIPTDDVATVPDEQLPTFDGMIGSTTLNEYDVLVDLPQGRMVLKPVGTKVDWPGVPLSDPVRLQVYHGVVFGLEVELAGAPYRATLDLGTASLVVNDPVQAALGLDTEDRSALTLGDRIFSDLPVKVLDLEILDRWDPSGTGFVLVGAPIAYDCAISLSWIHQEMRTCVR